MGANEAFTTTGRGGPLHRRPAVAGTAAAASRSTTRRPAPSPADVRSPRRAKSAARSLLRRRRSPRGPTRRRSAARACSTSSSPAEPTSRHAGGDDHRRARQGVQRRPGRGHARHRHRRVRLRHSAAAEGRLHRAGQHRHRQLDAAPAAGRRRRHHAVQLPVHGAVLDVPGGHRLRQYVHPEAQRARPVGRAVHGRAAGRGRPARRASSTSCRATRLRWTRCSSIPTSRR